MVACEEDWDAISSMIASFQRKLRYTEKTNKVRLLTTGHRGKKTKLKLLKRKSKQADSKILIKVCFKESFKKVYFKYLTQKKHGLQQE